MLKIAVALLALGSAASYADQLVIPVGQQGIEGLALPQKGQKMSQIEQTFGEPSVRHPARGEPPISRWEYENFIVYFESEHVIHAVLRHKPKAQYQEPQAEQSGE